MTDTAEDDDLALTKVSSDLLADLVSQLPRLLFKHHAGQQKLHTVVRTKHLESIIKLIEPFQSDPQLLDPQLKFIVPPIAEAFVQYLVSNTESKNRPNAVDLITALSTILYTLCKVRGRNVISGLLNNEPRYLAPIYERLVQSSADQDIWQVQYVLLLWLAHLLLTPFDLISISDDERIFPATLDLSLPDSTPTIAVRIIQICLKYLSQSAATQHVAALTLARLALRPDMQSLMIARRLVTHSLRVLSDSTGSQASTTYLALGHMRFLAHITKSGDSAAFLPSIYSAYAPYMSDQNGESIKLDAIGRSLVVKTVRNIIATSIHAAGSDSTLQAFISEEDVLEGTIEYLIRTLGDKETLVRHAAAKALGAIILAVGSELGGEIVSAILASLTDELPATLGSIDDSTVDPFVCHGCTLAISFALFRSSVAVTQLPRVAATLLAALSFAQRTAVGSISGTNIRDAANFGLWSLARRYTTIQLRGVISEVTISTDQGQSIIQTMANGLLQSACCDPLGNVRRGSSAALQELIGRHPDHVSNGIALVQAVDYQAVGLRRRALIDVAWEVMQTNPIYRRPVLSSLLGWRGVGSVDIQSRDAAATAITQQLLIADREDRNSFIHEILNRMSVAPITEVELRHGLILSIAMLVEALASSEVDDLRMSLVPSSLWLTDTQLDSVFSSRAIKAEIPVAVARLATALLELHCTRTDQISLELAGLDTFLHKLVSRSEDPLLAVIPPLIQSMYYGNGSGLEHITDFVDSLAHRINLDSTRPTVQGAGRVFALATLSRAIAETALAQTAFEGVLTVCRSAHVDWRIMGYRALGIALSTSAKHQTSAQFDLEEVRDVILAGLQDYTIDERGDVGSLVRLQAIMRAQSMIEDSESRTADLDLEPLTAAILRLSLEKLTRVRMQAALCRSHLPEPFLRLERTQDVDSVEYFRAALRPLWQPSTAAWAHYALLEGLVSCAGTSTEHILQHSRWIFATHLRRCSIEHVKFLMTAYTTLLRDLATKPSNLQAALELLAFFLQMDLMRPLQGTDFKFRALLSIVQRSHYKSTDVQRIVAAVAVYVGLGRIDSLRSEVLRKLMSMLKTSPYPRIRAAVGDALFLLTHSPELKNRDWSKPAKHNSGTYDLLQKRLIDE